STSREKPRVGPVPSIPWSMPSCRRKRPRPARHRNPRALISLNCCRNKKPRRHRRSKSMWEAFFGFKKTPFPDNPDSKQLFASQAWNQLKSRLQFLVDYHGAGLLTGEVGSGKSTAARTFTAALNPSLYKVLYLHWTMGSALDLLRQLALALDL